MFFLILLIFLFPLIGSLVVAAYGWYESNKEYVVYEKDINAYKLKFQIPASQEELKSIRKRWRRLAIIGLVIFITQVIILLV